MSETLEAMLAAVPDSYQKTVGFPTYDLLAAVAVRTDESAAHLAAAEAKLDPVNLTGAELDAYIRPRLGLARKAATYAVGRLDLTGTGTVRAGDLFESQGGVQFAALETVEVQGRDTVPVRCVTPGSMGNLPAGSITMMPVQIAGIVSVSNLDTTAEGYDAESDRDYFERFLLRLRTPPTSGNQYHYRAWALEVAGVGGVQVYPLGHGDNTVDVVIVDAQGQPASTALVAEVQDHIDPGSRGLGEGEAPIGAYCYVSAAEGVSLALSLAVTVAPGAEEARVTEAIREAVAGYLTSIAFVQDYVSYARIAAAVLESPGVLDYEGLTVNGGTDNIRIDARQVATLGEVTVKYAG